MSLILKSIFGLTVFLFSMSAVLFVTIGSLHFWQGWVFLAIIGVCSVLVTSYMLKFNQNLPAFMMSGIAKTNLQKKQRGLIILAGICLIGLIVVPGLDHRFQWSHVPLVFTLIADRLLVLAFYVIFLTFRETRIKHWPAEQNVITTGPYRLVRHPMYTGAILLFLCAPLALNCWVVLPFVLPLIIIVVMQVLAEEKLHATQGEYADYSQKVRYRLIPFVW
jgi:protein-S-isoprenylcysteine O-methyltransferase Ste14